ncbi:MAG TPA: hypothetical protein DEQ32_07780 [Gammaproteobacteria bacterium]|nr:hypothetical protein [Gammaproteobacteria bacterium]
MKLIRNALSATIAVTALSSPAIIIAEESSRTIEEIVVTSRRRDESVQDVPLSVTAFGEERIEQLKPTTLRDFDGLAPNVYIGMNTAGPGASALYIRGVGYADIEKSQSPQVGVIVDGIQMGSSTGQLIDVFDVESIEINRGPQGVLFGKNTIGGNIVVNRVRPQFNEFGLATSVELGNYDSQNVKARVNIPLIEDQLALKVGAIVRERDGYYDNLTLGQTAGDVDFKSYTMALRWAPSDNFEATLTYDNIDDSSQIPPQDPRFDGDDPFINLADKEEPTTYEVDQVSLRANWDINDNLTLHSITGWHDGFDEVNQDFDGAAIDGGASPFAQLHTLRSQDFEMFTQELRLTGSIGDDLDFMVGYYYYDSELDFQQLTNNVLQIPFGLPPGVPCAAAIPILRDNPNPAIGNALCQFPNARSTQIAGEEVESSAFFGSLTWRPTDKLELMVGVRNIQEDKEAFNSYFDHGTGAFDTTGTDQEHNFTPYPTVPGLAVSGDDDWDDTIMTASATYQLTDTNRLYVNYSEGFRSGGFSIRGARGGSDYSFDPEEADQIEIGSKNEFLDGALQLNIAYYKLEREAGQFSSIITLPPGSIPGTTTLINNGAGSENDGWEIEGRWIIDDNWSLIFNGGTMDADNKQFSIACENLDGCAGGDPEGTLRVLGGNDDSRQPEWSGSVSVAYVRDIGAGTLSANVGYKKVGSFLLVNTGGGADQRLFEGGYGQWDARVSYEMELANGATLGLSAYGRNLSDEEWREQALFLGAFRTGFQGWGAPRTGFFEIKYSM